MKALSIHPSLREVREIDIEMKANSIYSFFNSILIDELTTLNQHIIYSDANALSENKNAFFLGEQLIIGDALIIGQEGLSEKNVSISQKELESLVIHEINEFYKDVLSLLSSTDINLYRTFEVESPSEKIALNTEWVIYTFNIADERTKEYFLAELTKVLDAKESIEEYMKKMAGLAINAGS